MSQKPLRCVHLGLADAAVDTAPVQRQQAEASGHRPGVIAQPNSALSTVPPARLEVTVASGSRCASGHFDRQLSEAFELLAGTRHARPCTRVHPNLRSPCIADPTERFAAPSFMRRLPPDGIHLGRTGSSTSCRNVCLQPTPGSWTSIANRSYASCAANPMLDYGRSRTLKSLDYSILCGSQ